MVYRNMEPYIGIWLSAASFFGNKRWTNTANINQYIEGKRIDEHEVQILNVSDILIEEFFLRLRTHEGISPLSKFISVLVPNYESLLTTYMKEWLLVFDETKLYLTDTGMNVYNSIITDLLQKI
jgi:oxygen-independent coproporphyrinogen-3 oxidase